MNPITKCPECHEKLNAKDRECVCGWRDIQQKSHDGRCEYSLENRRCPLPGTICPYPYAKGPWFCAGHSRAMGDPKRSEAELRYAEENYEAIMAKRRNWHEVALEEMIAKQKKLGIQLKFPEDLMKAVKIISEKND